MKLLTRIPFLLAGLQLLSLGRGDKLEDKDSEKEKLSKEGITKTLTSAYDELSDLTDQLQDALDDTIKEAEKREVKLASQSEDEYLPPKKKKKDEYIPPKKKDEYIPPKKKVKVKKERPYLPPTRRPETGYVSPSKHDTNNHPEPPELASSYGLPPPPPGYDAYLQNLKNDHTIVTTYTVPPGSPLPDNHIIVPPEHLHFPPDIGYAKPLEDNDLYHEDSEDVFIVDSYIPKEEVIEEVYYEKHETYETTPAPTPVIDIFKYIPLFIVTTIAMAASIVFGNIIG